MSAFEKPNVRHKLGNPKGGMNLQDEGNLVPTAVKDFCYKVANKLIKAQFTDILKTSAPVYVQYPRTYLDGAAADLVYSSRFLTKAAETNDPIERIKLFLSMYIGGAHINPEVCQCRAPLNPVIGETLQRVFPDGTKFFAEQTSHHPPITNFMLEGPRDLYRFSGFFEYKAWLSGMSTIGGSRIGKQLISFKDGGLLTVKDPNIEISGLTYGERTHNMLGTMVVTDHINKLEAVVTYNPQSQDKSGGMLKSFKSKLFKRSTQDQQPTDYLQVQIMQKALNGNKKEKVVISEGSGSWLEYIEFDGKVYWTIEDEKPTWLHPNDESLSPESQDYMLKSDSSFRPDIKSLGEKNNDQAEKDKDEIESLQRHDKALRHRAQQRRHSTKK